VYWAKIAREVVQRGYELEESKTWAKTIVGRVAANTRADMLNARDCVLVENVLEELIETVAVLERLCFIADKAGVFKFSLQRILADFVNDVQLVADFGSYRQQILDEFDAVLSAVAKREPSAQIYLVAHSEGTVVTLTGLLRAIGMAPRPDWLERLHGVMTIGAPLDTHILLWPELWQPLTPASPWRPRRRIRWLNYYDYGDPIADALVETTAWLDRHNCDGIFEIENIGFSRYYFPGKAHIDYWGDEHVFGHFIEEVMGLPPDAAPAGASATAAAAGTAAAAVSARRFPEKPRSRKLAQLTSYLVPYGVIAALFVAAVFLLYRSVRVAAGWQSLYPLPGPLLVRDVAILAALLAGMSIAVRLPRLSTMGRWRLVGVAVFLAGAAVYAWPILIYPAGTRQRALHDTIGGGFGLLGVPASVQVWAVLVVAAVIAFVCAQLGRSRWNRAGVRTLLVSGGVVVVALVAALVWTGDEKDRGPLLPLVLGCLAFFYLWWLAVLLFDLVFVWHRYVRYSVAVRDLREIRR
jgi:hypothetical protein